MYGGFGPNFGEKMGLVREKLAKRWREKMLSCHVTSTRWNSDSPSTWPFSSLLGPVEAQEQ